MIAGHALDAYCTGGSSPPVRRPYVINGYTVRLTEAEADKVGLLGQHLTDICQSGRHDRLVVGVAMNGQCRGCSHEADERYNASKKGIERYERYEENHIRVRDFSGNTMAVFRQTPEVEATVAVIEAERAEFLKRQAEERRVWSEGRDAEIANVTDAGDVQAAYDRFMAWGFEVSP